MKTSRGFVCRLHRYSMLLLVALLLWSGTVSVSHAASVASAGSSAPQEADIAPLPGEPEPGDPTMTQRELQSAVDAAIAAGNASVRLTGHVTLSGSLKLRNLTKSITIEGGGYTLAFADPAAENDRHILITQPKGLNLSVTLRELRLAGPGGELSGGGISVGSGVDLYLEHCVIADSRAKDGGAVYNYNNQTWLKDSVIIGNRAESGGGIYTYYGAVIVEGAHTRLEGNSATSADAGGGAIYSARGNVVVAEGALLVSNEAVGYGGGILTHVGGSITLDRAFIYNNRAASGGGIASLDEDAEIAVRGGSILSGNAARGGDGRGFGGGIYRAEGGYLVISNSQLLSNTAVFGGGLFSGSGDTDRLEIESCTFRGNRASYDGGAIYTLDRITTGHPKPAYITVTRLDNNAAGRNGGGIYAGNHAALNLAGVGFGGNSAGSYKDWNVNSPDALYEESAMIYKNNIVNAEPSRHAYNGSSIQFTNVYNNFDVNFPVSYTLSFRTWGGRWQDSGTMENRSHVVFTGERAPAPGVPLRDGYVFGGWKIASASHPRSGDIWSFDATVSQSIAFDANWIAAGETVEVTLRPSGGRWADGTTGDKVVRVAAGGRVYQPDDLTRSGYTLAGWYRSTGTRWDFDTAGVTRDGIVLIARWTALPRSEAPVLDNPNERENFLPEGRLPAPPGDFDLIFDDNTPLEPEEANTEAFRQPGSTGV